MLGNTGILWTILLVFVLGVFPLYITVKLLGGYATILRVLIIKIAAIFTAFLLSMVLGATGPFVIALTLILIYRFTFEMGIIRSFLAWLLEGVVLIGIVYALGAMGIVPLKLKIISDAFMHAVNAINLF